MTLVRLQAETEHPPWPYGGTTATLRIYASQQFYSVPEGVQITAGQVGSQSWAYEYECAVNGDGNLIIPEVSLYATLDAQPATAKYTAVFFDSAGRKRNTKLSQFWISPFSVDMSNESSVEVSAAGTPLANGIYTYRGQSSGRGYYNLDTYADSTTSRVVIYDGSFWKIIGPGSPGTTYYRALSSADFPWEVTNWVVFGGSGPVPGVDEYATVVTSTWMDVINANQAYVPNYNIVNTTWSPAQIQQYVTNLVGDGTTPFSSSLRCGKTFLTEDPDPSTNPIAVAVNDPRWVNILNRKILSIDYDNDLATAIADIGSTPTELLITEASDTVNNDQTTPSTLLVTFQDEGQIDVGGGHVVTIGLMSPAPSKRLFTGSGVVHLAKNAVAEKDLSWWAGNSSTSDLSAAFINLFYNGGRCYVPPGVWKCTSVTIPSYTTLRGSGKGSDGTNGTVIQLYDPSTPASAPLKTTDGFRDIRIQDLTLSASSSTSSGCFLATSTTASFGLYFDNVSFYGTGASGIAQMLIDDSTPGWQCEEVFFQHCDWTTPNGGKSFRCKTPNSSVVFAQCIFGVGANTDALYLDEIGFLNLYTCQFAGIGLSSVPWSSSINRTIKGSITFGTKDLSLNTGTFTPSDIGVPVKITGKLDSYIDAITSATTAHVHDNATATAANENLAVYQWDANPARGGACIKLLGGHGTINAFNCVDEGMTWGFKNGVSTFVGPISFYGWWFQSWVELDQSCQVNLYGCQLSSMTLLDGGSAGGYITSVGSYVTKTTLAFSGAVSTLVKPSLWGVHNGVSIVQVAFDNNQDQFRQNVGLPTRFNYGQEYRFAPDTTNGFVTITSPIDTTGGPHIILKREGRADPITDEPDYYYDTVRNFDDGYYEISGNQALPNRGFRLNAPVEANTYVGAVVSPAQITTNAGTFYIVDNDQNVRMTSDANRTIGGLNTASLNQPAETGQHVFLSNIGSFTITFLHQSGGAAATERFICDTGSNIVCAPNETMHCWYDGTTQRWRTSKFNITGLTGNATGVTAANDFAVTGDSTFTGTITANDVVTLVSGGTTQGNINFTGGTDVIFTAGATNQSKIKITDDLANSMSIAEGSNDYLTFKTTNGAEQITAVKALVGSSSITSTSPTAGIGYAAGAGGVVSQGTSRTTAVSINKRCGEITLFSAAGSATPASFTVNNTTVAATDRVELNQKSGTDKYALFVTALAANSFEITFYDLTGTTTETPVIGFTVLTSVAS